MSKRFVIGCCRFLKNNLLRFISFFSSFLIVFSLLVSSVYARTVDVTNIEDFFEHVRFRTYDNYSSSFKWNDAFYTNYGSGSGMYQDTVDAQFIPNAEFSDMIVEDDKKVMLCMLRGNAPITELKAGSTLDIEMTISFGVPLYYFQPTTAIFGIVANASAETPFVYEGSEVIGDFISTEGWENYYGPDVETAWSADSVTISLHYEAEQDIPYAYHYLQFTRQDLYNGGWDYQFTNNFYCYFDYLNFHYTDDESEVISTITQNTDRVLDQIDRSTQDLIDSLSPDASFSDSNSSSFDVLHNAESDLMDTANDGVDGFLSILDTFSISSSNTLFRSVSFISSCVNSLVNNLNLTGIINYLIMIGSFGMLISLGYTIYNKKR